MLLRPNVSIQPFCWLLLICYISITHSQLANQNDTSSDPVIPTVRVLNDSAPSLDETLPPLNETTPQTTAAGETASTDASTAETLPPCPGMRPFLCYAYDGLNQPYPEWLQHSSAKCAACAVETPCDDGTVVVGNDAKGNRLALTRSCHPKFCAEGMNSSTTTECIKAVTVAGEKVLFPFNVCTREMVALGECDVKKLSTVAFDPSSIKISTEYMVQCDAGFTVPKFVVDAVAADTTRLTKLTCIPSLHQAAGYLKEDPSPLRNVSYDTVDPLNVTYCEEHGRRFKDSTCEPLPMCGSDFKTPLGSPFEHKLVQQAAQCEVPCVYEYGVTRYRGCVILDLVDIDAKKIFWARRGMAGPYAELMDEEENLMVGADSMETAEPVEDKAASTPIVRYPKCINTAALSSPDRERVDRDYMLNCWTNIFVQIWGVEGLMIDPPICDGDDDLRICWNRTDELMARNIIVREEPPLEISSWPPTYTGGAIGAVALVIGVVLSTKFLLCGRASSDQSQEKQQDIKITAVALPEMSRVYENIVLQEQDITGNWMDALDQLMTANPDPDQMGNLHFASDGHIALQVKKVEPCPQNSDDKIKCSVASDSLAVARNIFHKLADDRFMRKPGNGTDPIATFDWGELLAMFNHAGHLVGEQRGVVHLTGPVWILGDLNGDFHTAWRIFKAYSTMADPGTKILFLGNVGCRRPQALPVIVLVVAAMIIYPKQVFYLCGKFEGQMWGEFVPVETTLNLVEKDIGEKKKDGDNAPAVDQKTAADGAISDFFARLPLVATIDGRVLAMHGGPSPTLRATDLQEGLDPRDNLKSLLRRRTILSEPHWMVGIYKKKPKKEHRDPDRGYYFGEAGIIDALKKLGAGFIICATQPEVTTGIHFFGDWLISLCSSPSSASSSKKDGKESVGRIGAVLRHDGSGRISMLNFVPPSTFHESRDDFMRTLSTYRDDADLYCGGPVAKLERCWEEREPIPPPPVKQQYHPNLGAKTGPKKRRL